MTDHADLIQRLRNMGAEMALVAASAIEVLEAEVARLRTAAEWQPIETAPKDGTRILAWPCWSDNRPAQMYWREMKRKSRWEIQFGYSAPRPPIYWRPLPDAPVVAQGAEKETP